MSPPLRASRPATISIRVLLPQPEGPTTQMNSPGADVHVDFLQRQERLVAVLAEGLRDAADLDRHTGLGRGGRGVAQGRGRHGAVLPSLAATAGSGTLDTSSAFLPRCTTRSFWSTIETSKVAMACVGRDLLSRSSLIT